MRELPFDDIAIPCLGVLDLFVVRQGREDGPETAVLKRCLVRAALRKLTGYGATRARRCRPVQTGPDDGHGRQCQDEISRECKVDPGQ